MSLQSVALTAGLILGTPHPMPPTKEEAKHLFTSPCQVVFIECPPMPEGRIIFA